MSANLTAALEYASRGIAVFPCHIDKTPATMKGLYDASTNVDQIKEWFGKNDYSIGCPTGQLNGFIVLDVDIKDDHNGNASLKSLEKRFGKIKKSVQQTTGSGGLQLFFKSNPLIKNATSFLDYDGIDLRGRGGYVILPPSLHPSGYYYEWLEGHELDCIKLPDCPQFIVDYFTEQEESKKKAKQEKAGKKTQPALSASQIELLLTQLAPWRMDDYESWLQVGMAINAETGGSSEGFEIWANWSSQSEKYDSEYCERLWNYHFDPDGEITIGTLIHFVNTDNGRKPKQKQDTVKNDLTNFAWTDAGFADMFYYHQNGDIKYDATRDRWYLWNGQYWTLDSRNEILYRAIETARELKEQAKTMNDAKKAQEVHEYALKLENHARLTNMIKLAKVLPDVRTTAEDWDNNQFLIGCENGVVDLETGILVEGDKDQVISKSTHIFYDPTAKCPRWIKFLDEVFEGNAAVIEYIKKAVGYTLTGDIREQCFFMAIGNGRNGKSVFLKTILTLLGDYGEVSKFSAFERKNNTPTTAGLAKLAGCRMTIATEPNQGGAGFDEGLLKNVTGGEPITDKLLYENEFKFIPTFKIWLGVNHAPKVRDDSDGFWRRIKMINFPVKFEDNRDDKKLDAKLLKELPGILNWAIEGCLLWQKEGLGAPKEIIKVVEEYKENNDLLADFIAECFERSEKDNLIYDDAYAAYVAWTEQKGYKPHERLGRARVKDSLVALYGLVEHNNRKALKGLRFSNDPRVEANNYELNFQ